MFQLEVTRAKLKDTRQQVAQLESRCAQQQSTNQHLKHTVLTLTSEVSAKQAALEQQQTALKAQEAAYEAQLAALRAELEGAQAQLEKEQVTSCLAEVAARLAKEIAQQALQMLQDGASDHELVSFMRHSWGTSISSSARSSVADDTGAGYKGISQGANGIPSVVQGVPEVQVFVGDSSLRSSACSDSSSRRSSCTQFYEEGCNELSAVGDSKLVTPGQTEQRGSRRRSKTSRGSKSSRASRSSRISRSSRGSDASSSSVWDYITTDSDWDSPVEAGLVEPLPQGRQLTLQQMAAYLPAGSTETDFQLERVRHELQINRQQVVQLECICAQQDVAIQDLQHSMLALALDNVAKQATLQDQAAAYQNSMQSLYNSTAMWRIQQGTEGEGCSVFRCSSSNGDYSSNSGNCSAQVTMWSSGAPSSSWHSSSSNGAGSDESGSCSSSGTTFDADASRVAEVAERLSTADLEWEKAWLAAF